MNNNKTADNCRRDFLKNMLLLIAVTLIKGQPAAIAKGAAEINAHTPECEAVAVDSISCGIVTHVADPGWSG